HQGVRMRAAATLHGGHLLWVRKIAYIEDAHSAKTVRAWRRRRPARRRSVRIRIRRWRWGWRRRITRGPRDPLNAAVRAAGHRFRRHEQKVAIYGDISLAAGTQQ